MGKYCFLPGFEITPAKKTITVKVMLLSGVFDAPARCAVQNMVQFNGYYGCGTCYIRGQSVNNLKGTRTHAYPFDGSQEHLLKGHPEVRTSMETMKHAEYAEELKKPHMGVKGHAFLARLPGFDIIRGVTIDYMHNVLLGVMKMLLHSWTNRDYKNMNWFVGDKMLEMNGRLTALSPPNRITRLPRKLDDLAHWKASEYRSFLLYYAVPVLKGILPDDHLQHFLLLSKGIHILLQESISENDIREAEASILRFCMMVDVMYHPCLESSNIHALLHLSTKVRDLGPLWAHSCFFYEDLNGDLRNLFHGTVHAARQILNAISIQQELPRMAKRLMAGSPEAKLYDNMMSHRKLRSGLHKISDEIYAVEPLVCCTLSDDMRGMISLDDPQSPVHKFERLLLHHQVLHCKEYKLATRRNSYTVKFGSSTGVQSFGMIHFFLKFSKNCENKYVAIMENIKIGQTCDGLPPHIHPISFREQKEITVVPVECISELCILLESVNGNYVATFPNKVEHE